MFHLQHSSVSMDALFISSFIWYISLNIEKAKISDVLGFKIFIDYELSTTSLRNCH